MLGMEVDMRLVGLPEAEPAGTPHSHRLGWDPEKIIVAALTRSCRTPTPTGWCCAA